MREAVQTKLGRPVYLVMEVIKRENEVRGFPVCFAENDGNP